MPNVVLSPHVAGLSERSIATMTEQATTHVLNVLRGHWDAAVVVNPAVLSTSSELA